jgi:uncharacterized metal-binding protein YceD (DUF177 family)
VSKPTFVVPVADLERGAKSVTWPISVGWLQQAFGDVDAKPAQDGALEVELTKNGNEVLVRGRADVSVTVPCVVTLEPLPFRLTPEIFLLLSPATTPDPGPGRGGRRRGAVVARGGRGPKKPASEAWTADDELSNKDAARDTYQGDKIVLDDFVREFILLELPMYPRRSDLPLDESPARGTPLPPSPPADLSGQTVDPRLLPLAELRDRLRQNKKE